MTAPACRVYVVADEQYGELLCDLSRLGPIWIVDAPVNREGARKLWAERPDTPHLVGVTTFKCDERPSPEDVLIAELDTIDLHHGRYSGDIPHTPSFDAWYELRDHGERFNAEKPQT